MLAMPPDGAIVGAARIGRVRAPLRGRVSRNRSGASHVMRRSALGDRVEASCLHDR
jgi:hypothetical protein